MLPFLEKFCLFWHVAKLYWFLVQFVVLPSAYAMKKLTDSWQRLKQFCELPGNCTNWNVFMQLDGNTNPFEFQRALKQLVASPLLKDWTVHHQEPQKSATKRENTGEPTAGNFTLFFFGSQSVFTLIWMYLRSIIPSNKVLVWKKKNH